MGKEDKVGTINSRKGGLPFTSPVTLKDFLREGSSSPQLSDIMRHPAAPTLFSMARDSARRVATSLSDLRIAVTEGNFDSDTLEITQRQVLQRVQRDPVYIFADTFYQSTTQRGLPLLHDGNKEGQEERRDMPDVFVFDGIPYGGVIGRTMRLLVGATQDYPLTTATLATLIYPEDLNLKYAVSKIKPQLFQKIPIAIATHHLTSQFIKLPNTSCNREGKYFIQTPPAIEAAEVVKPVTTISIHRDKDYIQVSDRLVYTSPTSSLYPQEVQDALFLLRFFNNHQGLWIHAESIDNAFFQDNQSLTPRQIRSRLQQARNWLNTYITNEGMPLLQRSNKVGGGVHYGIHDVAIQIEESTKPYQDVLNAEIERDPSYVSLKELEVIYTRVEDKNFFTFPEGTTLIGKYAKLAYLLLRVAPKISLIPYLQQILYREVSPETRNDFIRHVLPWTNRFFEQNLPEIRIEKATDKGETGIAISGYEEQLDLEGLMSKRKSATIYRKNYDSGIDQNGSPLDPEIMRAFTVARPIIDRMNEDKLVLWPKYSGEEIQAFVQVIAYELGKPVSMLDSFDFHNRRNPQRFEIIGNKDLYGFIGYIRSVTPVSTNVEKFVSPKRTVMSSFLESIVFTPTIEDLIEQIKSGRKVPWDRITWKLTKELISLVMNEDKNPFELIGYMQLKKKRNFLGKQNLRRLPISLQYHPEKHEDESATDFLRRKLGLPKMDRGSRTKFRGNEIKKITKELAVDLIKGLSDNQLMQYTEKLARLYHASFPKIEIDELQNEAYIATGEALGKRILNEEEFISRIQTHLEDFIKQAVTRTYYQERSIDAPMGSSDKGEEALKVKDILEADLSAQDFSLEWRDRLSHLTPLQRFLVLSTPDSKTSFEIIAEEIQKRFDTIIDIDMLQEQYQEALDILRETIKEDS